MMHAYICIIFNCILCLVVRTAGRVHRICTMHDDSLCSRQEEARRELGGGARRQTHTDGVGMELGCGLEFKNRSSDTYY